MKLRLNCTPSDYQLLSRSRVQPAAYRTKHCIAYSLPRPGAGGHEAHSPSRLSLRLSCTDHNKGRCVGCKVTSSAFTSPSEYEPGASLDGRYEILDLIGRGASGVTYKARGAGQDNLVAIKVLSLRSSGGWKQMAMLNDPDDVQIELFEREAQALKGLSHPNIPNYIEYFEVDTPNDRLFCLVQDLAEGQTLAQLVKSGWRGGQEDVTSIACKLLAVLDYLASRLPPVIHRDLNPNNIILEGGSCAGRLYLVDFGGVQAASAAADGTGSGTTIVGTYGYMAPEQFRGAASPASDLYALGAIVLFLSSGKAPSSFPQVRMRVDVSSLDLPPRLAVLIEGLLEPLQEDRMSAADALTTLTQDSAALDRPNNSQVLTVPGMRSQLTTHGRDLMLAVPPAALLSKDNADTAGFAIAWNGAIAAWTLGVVSAGSVVGALFSLPFWFAGARLAKEAFAPGLAGEELLIGPTRWNITRTSVLPRARGRRRVVAEGRTSDLQGLRFTTTGYINGFPMTVLQLVEGVQTHDLAQGLPYNEQRRIANAIVQHMTTLLGREVKVDDVGPLSPRQYSKFDGPGPRDQDLW